MDKILLEKFMRELREGNADALDGIYMLTSKGVYLLALSILKNAEKAKDIMQDTFIRVAANIDKYRPETNASAWILKISRNLSYREYHSSGRSVSLETLGENALHAKGGEAVWAENADLANALAKLSAAEREIVILFSTEGYKHREIAQITGKPLGTVLWIYNKAIKKLKKFMQEGQ